MEEIFKELIQYIFVEYLKTLGWRKQGNNFRCVSNDGLGKIINFQKSRRNTSEKMVFYINYGVYMEPANNIANKAFREYDCQFRARTEYLSGEYSIDSRTDVAKLKEQILTAIKETMEFMERVCSKEDFVKMLLSGEAQKYTDFPVMHYDTCKVLCEMGYYREIYDIVKFKDGKYFNNLKREIEEHLINIKNFGDDRV